MFIAFFYLLRARGLKVSIGEWMTLTRALEQGLAGAGLTGFYWLCRTIVVCSEADFDKFDVAFAEYFDGIKLPDDLPEEFWKWLSDDKQVRDQADRELADAFLYELDELKRMFEERKIEQTERHDGGNYWIGTGGTSVFGNSGYHERGIRAGGEGRHSHAVQVAGERNFKDFRQDNILDSRQFQVAFRKLRQYSSRIDAQKTELDIDETIKETGDHGGSLRLVYAKPRKNTVKLLVLFDAGGSMRPYSRLTSRLFLAVSKSNHFKDVKFYYFHNCIYDKLYTEPQCRRNEWVDTEYVLNNLDAEYRVIFVGDAAMAPSELDKRGGNAIIGLYNERPGREWLERFRKRYGKCIWLNPIPASEWAYTFGNYTIEQIETIFPMFELTIDGLEAGIKKLIASR
ncbi:MAG: VWA domain-containing protein [Clostridiales Family XIII bacterium]|jgi:uncharacterized protein with von Willebrand factor type A (vWA) domain|nr:VWA domain-containing protein [Clostridiales Family XIII bacterium]